MLNCQQNLGKQYAIMVTHAPMASDFDIHVNAHYILQIKREKASPSDHHSYHCSTTLDMLSKRTRGPHQYKNGQIVSAVGFLFYLFLYICQFKMVNPTSQKRKSGLLNASSIKNKKSKKPRVTVKEELNTEIPSPDEPRTPPPSANDKELAVEVITPESFSSTQADVGSGGNIAVQQDVYGQLAMHGENAPCLPPISSLLLYKPGVEANEFDPFYQSVDSYIRYAIPYGSSPQANVKRESVRFTAPIRQTMDPAALPPMPLIPYYFHHKQFGMEACMHQLQQQRHRKGTTSCYTNTASNGANYFYRL